jgi:hypothetical protein
VSQSNPAISQRLEAYLNDEDDLLGDDESPTAVVSKTGKVAELVAKERELQTQKTIHTMRTLREKIRRTTPVGLKKVPHGR